MQAALSIVWLWLIIRRHQLERQTRAVILRL
jgi:hypothetical protein